MKLGFDFGSRNLHFALISEDRVIHTGEVEHRGDIKEAFAAAFKVVKQQTGGASISTVGMTGNLETYPSALVDPIIASCEASRFLQNRCRAVLSIGCESFYLILLDEKLQYCEHGINSDCASGTGSFIDQQAERIGFSTTQLAACAGSFAGKCPAIASRCAVFAKSDIIHAQTLGYSRDAISAGICQGVVQSIVENLVKGRELPPALLLVGGVSRNAKVVAELRRQLGREIMVIPEGMAFHAIGAALLGVGAPHELGRFVENMGLSRGVREPLVLTLPDYPDFAKDPLVLEDGVEITRYESPLPGEVLASLGIDIGSTSTKMVILDEKERVLAGLYTRTKGDPIAATRLLLQKAGGMFAPGGLRYRAVVTTGSGRLLVGRVFAADDALNEISAHASGAAFIDPLVDTIIEIGGQDAKFTRIRDGEVAHTVMNYVCAAGTGSFIEEQAKRLGVALDEIAQLAQNVAAPYTSDRCTVYMERDLNRMLAEGWSRAQIMAAVLFSVRDNYLSKVVARAPLGERIHFQGATGRNRALVAAFAQRLGTTIHVSRFCHLTGALGAALTAARAGYQRSTFRGAEFSCETTSEICELCANRCQLNVTTVDGRKNAWGLKCGRDYEDRKPAGSKKSRLEQAYAATFCPPSFALPGALTIGIPRALYMEQYFPLFQLFFNRLGFNVVLTGSSDQILRSGKKMVAADFCTPMNLAHGQAAQLLGREVDLIFFPTILNEQDYFHRFSKEQPISSREADCCFCYTSLYAPMVIKNLVSTGFAGKIVTPLIRFNHAPLVRIARELADALAGPLSRDAGAIKTAFRESYADFKKMRENWLSQGHELLSRGDGLKVLLLGRPYVLFDPVINGNIPARIEQLGFALVHQGMLDLGQAAKQDLPGYVRRNHWYFGQQILLALESVKTSPELYPVLLTCFRCSPDAYIISYFKARMDEMGRPYLILQLDELGGDAGYQTRIEAGADAFRHHYRRQLQRPVSAGRPALDTPVNHPFKQGDTVYLPFFSTITNRLMESAYRAHGFRMVSMPIDAAMIEEGYRHASGGECLPNIAIVGAVLHHMRQPEFDPQRSIFFCWSMCIACNFPQFFQLLRTAMHRVGRDQVRTRTVSFARPDPNLSWVHNIDVLTSQLVAGLLGKLYWSARSCEQHPGSADAALARAYQLLDRAWLRPRSQADRAAQLARGAVFGLLTRAGDEVPDPESRLARLSRAFHPDPRVLAAVGEIARDFRAIPRLSAVKPRIAVIGDLYVKWSPVVNQDIFEQIHQLGGELVVSSFSEYLLAALHHDWRYGFTADVFYRFIRRYENSFENAVGDLIQRDGEPSARECDQLTREYGLDHWIGGEIEINVGRVLYMIKHQLCDAFVNLNPIMCCPGTASTSIFRKIQKDFGVPIIDIFYDGTNRPNNVLIPHLAHLRDIVAKRQKTRP